MFAGYQWLIHNVSVRLVSQGRLARWTFSKFAKQQFFKFHQKQYRRRDDDDSQPGFDAHARCCKQDLHGTEIGERQLEEYQNTDGIKCITVPE